MVKKLKKIKLELNEAYQKVLYWFFSFPNIETGLNELSSNLKISKTTAKRIVNILVKDGFLNKKVYGKAWRITCNIDHYYNLTSKIVFNLAMIYKIYYKYGLRDRIFNIVGNAKSIILFGSYRKGDDTEESDIDIAVEVSDGQFKIVEIPENWSFGFRENVKVNLHIFSRNKIDLNLFSNIANGVVLEGFLEVKL